MKKDFYLFRHGQTDMNAAGRWQGRGIDLPLNETGREQARELAAALTPAALEVVFSSPLKRAVQTAQIVAEILRIPVQIEQGLTEGCFGEAEGKTKQEINMLFPQTAADWHSLEEEFMDVRFNGGETKREIQQRILKTLTKIAAESNYTVIGVCAHSAVIRCFILLFGPKLYTVPHGRPFHLVFEENNFRLLGD
ncbi:MAG: histidine phosphatase family protein [Alphaproteobacteria bacterium]|nr:histidine phosphatase family protein [Alphaproteobacteria bacterium]MBO4642983.1 histidine phosphatase family protein [Alphaproteobacteria bacterium]